MPAPRRAYSTRLLMSAAFAMTEKKLPPRGDRQVAKYAPVANTSSGSPHSASVIGPAAVHRSQQPTYRAVIADHGLRGDLIDFREDVVKCDHRWCALHHVLDSDRDVLQIPTL